MPVVGSSAYNTAGQITALVRSLLNDAQGNLFTDAVLLPYLNSAYRKAQRAIGNAGGGGFIQDDALLVVTAVAQQDASLQVSISDATAPPNQLPTDLLVPMKLWERANLSSDDFVEMVDLTRHGGLPSRSQDVTLSVWEWRADGLWFLGATQDTDSFAVFEGVSRFYGCDFAGVDTECAGSAGLCDGGAGGVVEGEPVGGEVG